MNAIRITASLLLLALLAACGSREGGETPGPVLFYAGSSDRELEHSLFLCSFDPVSAGFVLIDSFAGAESPYYLDLSPDGKTLYCVDKTVIDRETQTMQVTAFRVDPESHGLHLLNSQSSHGEGPCHISCGPEGKYLFVTNYFSGNIAVYPLAKDGSILPATSVVRGMGSGPVTERQEGPHTHQANLAPGGGFLLVPDLGSDRILNYVLDRESGTLTPNPAQPFLEMAPGSGPRHLAFYPSGEYLYIANELNATVTACSFHAETGVTEIIETEPAEEGSPAGSLLSAAIRIHPGGRFLYVSNRGESSSISMFRIGMNGTITPGEVERDVPYWPRDFQFCPGGRFLLVAGERANRIVPYTLAESTGMLERMDGELVLPSPGCILYIGEGDQKSLNTP